MAPDDKKREEIEMSVGPGGFILGSAPKLDEPKEKAAQPTQSAEVVTKESTKIAPDKEKISDISKYFQLVHSATYNSEWSKNQGRPYYTIRVRLEADSPEFMQKVSKVIYHLHPTFPNPDREIKDLESNFELKTYGWGQFNLSADVYFDDNSKPVRLFRYINF